MYDVCLHLPPAFLLFRYRGTGVLTQDTMIDVLVAYSKDANKTFKFPGESGYDKASPSRATYSPDTRVQFGRTDLVRWMHDNKSVNRCQKPIWLLRCEELDPFPHTSYEAPSSAAASPPLVYQQV